MHISPLLFLLFFYSNVLLAGSDALDLFYQNTQSFSAEFEQQVQDKSSGKSSRSKGTLSIKRPNKFLLFYLQPDQQQYVSDGKTIWMYDVDLEQVTVQQFDQKLKHSPIFLLSNSQKIRSLYHVKETVDYDFPDHDIFILTAKKEQDSNMATQFSKLELVFSKNVLYQLKMFDHFEHVTELTFYHQKMNAELTPNTFNFNIPPHVDVIDNTARN